MKCPKCNYVSHDYLDACRKCGRDLAAFKQEIGLLVLQPGELDLSLVLGGAGADDLFGSGAEEATLHVSDDDDFDISLDDYADHQPGARRFQAATPQGGGRAPEEEVPGLDHLTLELDASSLSAELAAHLRAAQALPDPALPQPSSPPLAAPGESALPSHVTLDMEPNNLSGELQPGVSQEHSVLPPMSPPPAPAVPGAPDLSRSLALDLSSIDLASTALPAGPVEQFEMAEETAAAAMAEEVSPGEATPVARISETIPSLQMQDILLAEETPAALEASPPESVEPTIPTIELVDMEATLPQRAAETSAAPPEVALSSDLPSVVFSTDDAPFVTRDVALPSSDPPPSVEPLVSRIDETRWAEERRPGAFALEPTPEAFVDEETLQDLPIPTLNEADFASVDDTLSPLPPQEQPDVTASVAPEGLLTSSDMGALSTLQEPTPPAYVTLEMNAPDLPDDLMSSLFEEVAAPLPQDDPTRTGAATGAEAQFTASDAMALEDLDKTTLPPGHLTLELDAPDFVSDVSSTVIAPLDVDHPSGTAQPPLPPPVPRADKEEELVLDLDDLEFDDDKR